MDEPKVPDDSRNWESINIYLFSNGQQYSPPRKHHLEVDDIKSWSATKNYLARSQFGSTHSAIELYSLEGKKVETPLELKNSVTYVAVEPPDAFIPAGYEKYLIKASRSREKRQEKLLNNEEEAKSDDMDMYLDLNKVERNEGIITLKTITEDPITETNKTIIPPPLNNDRKLSSNAKNNFYPITKSNGANSSSITRNTITKKSNLSSLKINSQIFSNKKNTPVLKNQRRNNKQRNMSSENSVSPAEYTGDSLVPKSLLKIDKDQITANGRDLKSNIQNNTNPVKENLKQLSFSNKDLIAVSNVYKNKNSDESSIIFTETERKATITDNFKLPREFSKPNLLTEQLVHNSLETNKKTSDVPIPEQIQNNKDALNIKLRIKLDDFTSSIIAESGNHLKEKTSFITLVKREKASQVNIDVILSKDIFTYNNNLYLKGKSLESCIKLDNEKLLPHNDNANIFVIHCKCNNIDSKNCISNMSHYNKAESNDVLVTPTTKNEETKKSCTSDSKKIETHDIEIQNSISSIKIRNQSIVSNYSQDVTKHKVSITQENQSINDSNTQSEFQDVQPIKRHDPLVKSKVFIDKYVQTDWCNVLLQAKCHEDGRYSFHLPALSLLKYYKMNQLYHIYYLSLT